MVRRTVFITVCSMLTLCILLRGADVKKVPRIQQDTLHTDTIAIDEIYIERKIDARSKFEDKKAYHKEIYLLGDNKNMVTFSPFGGIALNIQKLYNHFSNRGRAARRLQAQFEREFEEDLASEIWDPLLLEYTTLRGDSLQKFKLYCSPNLAFLNDASHYERVEHLLRHLKMYRDSVNVIHDRLRLIPKEGDK
ncbi:hypothetical protein [Sphingobacterium paludis]|uniref:Uncharacterized protein n=1 Tax=Sphingobacterium paludis TaxID=1476465 RepID=A0A4R7D437_9SPHI|nr:hypothetical protein [Sphingobacterium paludis]TDS15833.1 hypothetical protein B0I21_102149 [Sphingobacterium paludis]